MREMRHRGFAARQTPFHHPSSFHHLVTSAADPRNRVQASSCSHAYGQARRRSCDRGPCSVPHRGGKDEPHLLKRRAVVQPPRPPDRSSAKAASYAVYRASKMLYVCVLPLCILEPFSKPCGGRRRVPSPISLGWPQTQSFPSARLNVRLFFSSTRLPCRARAGGAGGFTGYNAGTIPSLESTLESLLVAPAL